MKKGFNKEIKTLKENIEKNRRDGFVPLCANGNVLEQIQSMVGTTSLPSQDIESFCDKTRGDELAAGNLAISAGKIFSEPTVEKVDGVELNGNGAVKWGADNNLPAYIYKTAKVLPYTAQALEYQTNASVGMAHQFMYKYAIVSGGSVIEKSCDFHLAGVLLRAKIRELRKSIEEIKEEKREEEGEFSIAPIIYDNEACKAKADSKEISSYRTKSEEYKAYNPFEDVPDDDIASLQSELNEAITEYKEWFVADKEIREFEKNNDLSKVFNELAQDDLALDLCFPLIGLEMGTKKMWEAEGWIPKIVKLSYSPAVISRFELKDDNGNINSVYANEGWRYHYTQRKTKDAKTIEFPLIRWSDFHLDLQDKIKKQKEKKSNSGWTEWYAVPNKHLSTEIEYYTVPAWWSIYPSLAFNYATTLMFDKSIERSNNISWRRIIYVDQGYLEKLYAEDNEGQSPERQKEIRENLEKKVNDFLSNKSNNGKTLMVDSTVTDDGRTLLDSIRVVTLPETSQKTTEDEIHAISSVLFYALGLDPRLIGAVPGKQNSSSGTQARELELLNQKKLVQRKARQKRLLLFIAQHNGWCPQHIDVVVKEQTLSTLDASKTGIVDSNT